LLPVGIFNATEISVFSAAAELACGFFSGTLLTFSAIWSRIEAEGNDE
jgi:hypothetical protein